MDLRISIIVLLVGVSIFHQTWWNKAYKVVCIKLGVVVLSVVSVLLSDLLYDNSRVYVCVCVCTATC